MLRTPQRRRLATLVTLAACAAVLPLALAPAAAAAPTTAPAGTASALPRTGFEVRNGADWTTEAEETAFLRQVDRATARVAIDQVGTTLQGRPLRLVQIGYPAPPSAVRAARGSVVLFTCSQHGDEPAGREGCLSLIRDLAVSTDPAIIRLLRQTTVLFIPTANPDGRAADTRGNAAGVDINRDHVALATPEGRAHAQVIRDWQPDVVHDAHEYGANPPVYDRDALWLWPRNLNVAAPVHDMSMALSRDRQRTALAAAGFTSGEYGIFVDPVTGQPIQQIAGDEQERILRNTAGLKNAVGLLLETRVDALTPAELADPALNNRRRVDTHRVTIRTTLRLVLQRRAAIEQATAAARARASVGIRPVVFAGADNQPPAPDQVDAAPPCAYRLDPAQYAAVRDTLALHGVRSRPAAGGARLVPRAQPLGRLVPLLLDARGLFHLVAATPVPC
jgi:predicted small lipoprotein YifL